MVGSNPANTFRGRLLVGMMTVGLGIGMEYAVLFGIERWVTDFPRIPDILMDRLPLIQFGWIGEAFFFGLVAVYIWKFFRTQGRYTPDVLVAIGFYYCLRAIFLLFLPIGTPLDAAPVDQRLDVWGFAQHAYFPGGHIGILTLLTLSLRDRAWRRWFWVGVVILGIGTVLNKTHYVADSIAGVMFGWGVWTWLERRKLSDRVTGSESG